MYKLGFILFLIISSSSSYQIEKYILNLHQEDFPLIFKQYPQLLIQFYAPWCGQCKKSDPIYKQIAQDLKQKGSQYEVQLAKLDSTVQTRIAKQYNIINYPTIKFFIEGVPTQYNGEFKKKDIMKWLEKKNLPIINQINSLRQLKRLDNQQFISIVYFGYNVSQIQIFENIALNDDQNVYYIAGKNLVLQNQTGRVEIHKYLQSTSYYNNSNFYDLEQWIKKYSKPFILEFESKTIRTIFAEDIPALVFFNAGYDLAVHSIISRFAKEYEGNLIFTEIQPENDHFVKFADYINISPKESKLIIILANSKEKIIYEEKLRYLTLEKFKRFINDFQNGQLKRYGLFDIVEESSFIFKTYMNNDL